jgi:hypothetical protein
VAIEPLEQRAYFSVDLTGSISVVGPASGSLKPGKPVSVSITVVNDGTTAAVGALQTTVGVSLSADGSSPQSLGSVTKHIKLQAGAQTTFKVNEKVPVGFTPGTYFLTGDIDPGNTFAETNLANNFFVSANTLTVLSPFPNIDGTYSGTATVKKGLDKGLVVSQVITNSNENDATGAYTFAGTNFYANGVTTTYTGIGTVKTNGSFVATGSDVPADETGTFRDVGKFVGDKAIGTYVNAVNSGTFSGTLEG